MPFSNLRRAALPGLFALLALTASLPGHALTLGEYRSGRSDAGNRESQDAYLYVTFQGMVWYGTALHDTSPDAPLLFCMKPEAVPGEQAVADLLLTETSELKGDEASTVPMEVVMIKGLQKRFPCK